eukprot:11203617-Lingulodinium_polyedra.AAC.1
MVVKVCVTDMTANSERDEAVLELMAALAKARLMSATATIREGAGNGGGDGGHAAHGDLHGHVQ